VERVAQWNKQLIEEAAGGVKSRDEASSRCSEWQRMEK
jgi:hypothetical protein